MSLDAIAALLGHKTLAMTMIYARIADKTVAEEYFAVTEKVEALYDQPRQLPADDEGTEMRKLRGEMHRRMLGNGYCARPVEMDCHFESICEILHLLRHHHRVPAHPASPTRRRRPQGPSRPQEDLRRPPRPSRPQGLIAKTLDKITRITTTDTDRIRASRTPDLCARCPRGSLIQTYWPTSTSEDATASAAFSTSTSMPRDLCGRGYRQGHGCLGYFDVLLSWRGVTAGRSRAAGCAAVLSPTSPAGAGPDGAGRWCPSRHGGRSVLPDCAAWPFWSAGR